MVCRILLLSLSSGHSLVIQRKIHETWPNKTRKNKEKLLLCSLLLKLCRMQQGRVTCTQIMTIPSSNGKRHGECPAGNIWDINRIHQMKRAMRYARKDEQLSALQT